MSLLIDDYPLIVLPALAEEIGLNDLPDTVSEYFNHILFSPILNNVYMRALSAVTYKSYMTRRYMWKVAY